MVLNTNGAVLKNKDDFLLDTTWTITYKNHLIGLIYFPNVNFKKLEITINLSVSQEREYFDSLKDIIYILNNFFTNYKNFNTVYIES